MGEGRRKRTKRKRERWVAGSVTKKRPVTITIISEVEGKRGWAFRLPEGVVGKVER